MVTESRHPDVGGGSVEQVRSGNVNNSCHVPLSCLELPVPHSVTEARHIGFLKVHKAASSTMQNIFFRFGLNRNLTFVFTDHPNYFSRTTDRHLPLVPPRLRSGGYDILCNHGMFNRKTYGSVLPPDAVYIAIVRDPLQQFISSVNYYSQPGQLLPHLAAVPGNKVQNLIRMPQYDRTLFSYTRNTMARDFGFPVTTNPKTVADKLDELENTFTVVLLVEYFPESLILMKRILNWSLADILFISNNVLSKPKWSVHNLTVSDLQIFRKRNYLDYKVYEHFHARFWVQVRAEGAGFNEEVLHFRSVLDSLTLFCKGNPGEDQTLTVTSSDWNEDFEVTGRDCAYMRTDELKFISLLRRIQGSELRRSRRHA